MGRHPEARLHLNDAEIERAFAGKWGEQFPPILDVAQAAQLARVTPKTLYDWSHRGLLKDCAHKTGKRLRVWRNGFIRFLFEYREDKQP